MVVVQECGETLDPALQKILYQEVLIRGGQPVMLLGDTEIEYNDGFRYMYM